MIKPGSRWKSRVCDAEIAIIRAPKAEGVPQCGGVDMVLRGTAVEPTELVSGFDGGCETGKRYRGEAVGLEVLCTARGKGALGFGGVALTLLETKKLPASD
jgi:hypothetical protein